MHIIPAFYAARTYQPELFLKLAAQDQLSTHIHPAGDREPRGQAIYQFFERTDAMTADMLHQLFYGILNQQLFIDMICLRYFHNLHRAIAVFKSLCQDGELIYYRIFFLQQAAADGDQFFFGDFL